MILAMVMVSLPGLESMAQDASGQTKGKESGGEALAIATFVTGEVKYKRGNDTKNVNVKTIFNKNDTVITNQGRVNIQVGPNAIIQLSPYSSISLAELYESGDRQNIEILVNSGRIYSKIVRKLQKGSTYLLYTSTLTAGVRGTEFLFSQPGKNEKKHEDSNVPAGVFVNDGKVLVRAEGDNLTDEQKKETVLNPKEQVLVTTNGFKKEILQKFIDKKMEIFKKLDVMKEENYKMLKDQKERNREMLKKIRGY